MISAKIQLVGAVALDRLLGIARASLRALLLSRWEGFYTPTGLMPRALSGCKIPPTSNGVQSTRSTSRHPAILIFLFALALPLSAAPLKNSSAPGKKIAGEVENPPA